MQNGAKRFTADRRAAVSFELAISENAIRITGVVSQGMEPPEDSDVSKALGTLRPATFSLTMPPVKSVK